jgi:hypothetical protein
MLNNQDKDTIERESFELKSTLKECMELNWSRGYTKLSLEGLSKMYDKIDDGLISCGLIANCVAKIDNQLALDLNQDGESIGKFLESQLIKVVIHMIIQGPTHLPPKKFKDSLYNSKIKDRAYYNELFRLTEFDLENREYIYTLLQR